MTEKQTIEIDAFVEKYKPEYVKQFNIQAPPVFNTFQQGLTSGEAAHLWQNYSLREKVYFFSRIGHAAFDPKYILAYEDFHKMTDCQIKAAKSFEVFYKEAKEFVENIIKRDNLLIATCDIPVDIDKMVIGRFACTLSL